MKIWKQQSLLPFLLLLIHVLSSYTSAEIKFCSQKFGEGQRLNATVYRKVFSFSALDCMALCVSDKCCRATNYEKSARCYEKENCEILYEVETDSDIPEEGLEVNLNFDYLKLRQPERELDCHCSPCKNGGTCIDGQQCSCPVGYVGKRCETKLAVKSCAEYFEREFVHDGIYRIDPDGLGEFEVRCEKKVYAWTVFQRRITGSQNFDLGWENYREGFGDLDGDFWLGLEKIHRLTESGLTFMKVNLQGKDSSRTRAKYGMFKVSNGNDSYKLTIGAYNPDNNTKMAGDTLARHNGTMFSTKDRDNDGDDDCADHQGGWWYLGCFDFHLNRNYSNEGMKWTTWPKELKETSMRIRPPN